MLGAIIRERLLLLLQGFICYCVNHCVWGSVLHCQYSFLPPSIHQILPLRNRFLQVKNTCTVCWLRELRPSCTQPTHLLRPTSIQPETSSPPPETDNTAPIVHLQSNSPILTQIKKAVR